MQPLHPHLAIPLAARAPRKTKHHFSLIRPLLLRNLHKTRSLHPVGLFLRMTLFAPNSNPSPTL